MAEIVVNSKNSLLTTTENLLTKTETFRDRIESEISTIQGISNCDEIDLSSAANTIINNFEAIFTDCVNVAKTANNYINNLMNIDVDDFSTGNSEEMTSTTETYESSYSSDAGTYTSYSSESSYSGSGYSSSGYSSFGYSGYGYSNIAGAGTIAGSMLGGISGGIINSNGGKYPTTGVKVDESIIETVEGTEIILPSGLGSVRTYMGWQCITNTSSQQYKLMQTAGVNFDEEGFGKIGDRYVVATTTTFGNVGDFIDVYQADGTVIKCIIGDIKNQNDAGCNKWGHLNGECVLESVVDKNTWYSNGAGSHPNPGTAACHPEWNQDIVKIVNKGNYFEYIAQNNVSNNVK